MVGCHRLGGVGACVAGFGTGVSEPTPGWAPAVEQRAPVSSVVDAVLAGDLRESMLSSLEAVGGDRVLLEALADGAEGEQLHAAPDVDGDGLADVVGLARASYRGKRSRRWARSSS